MRKAVQLSLVVESLWARKVSCFCESLCKTIFERTTRKLYSLRETEWSQQMGANRCTLPSCLVLQTQIAQGSGNVNE